MSTQQDRPQASPEAPTAQALAFKGLSLMARHRNLVHSVVSREIDVDELLAWTRSLTDEDWDLLAAAERDAARFLTRGQRQDLVKAYDDSPMAGRR